MRTTPWIRLVLAISLDGRLALPEGGSQHLGNEGDREVLEEALAWSDATLFGGGTLRAHKSTCLIHQKELISQRLIENRSKQPIAIVVSNQKKFCTDWKFFHQPIQRWLLSSKSSSANQYPPTGYDRQFRIEKSWEETLRKLGNEGLSKIILLGGAILIESLSKSDQIDEIQLTLTPKIIGGKHTWIPPKNNNLPLQLRNTDAWDLKKIKPLQNNELMLCYIRNRLTQSENEV